MTTSAPPSQSPSPAHSWRFWLAALVGYYLLWMLTNGPGIFAAWWYGDDYWMMEQGRKGIWDLAWTAGRPVTSVQLMLHFLQRTPEDVLGNIGVRLLSGLFHAGSGVLIAAMLRPYLRVFPALLVPLPFLLWPFNGEAVLWFGGMQHVLGAFFSILAVLLAYHGMQRRSPVLLIGSPLASATAVLANQAPIGIGPFLWLMTAGVRLAEQGLSWKLLKRLLAEGALFSVGFIGGGAWSLHLVNHYAYERATGEWIFEKKFAFLQQLIDYLLLFPGFYQKPIPGLHILLLILVGVALLFWLTRRSCPRAHLSGATLLLLSLLTAPILFYAANLVTPTSWASLRIMYTAPVIFGACAFIAWKALPPGRWQLLPSGLIMALACLYGLRAHSFTAQYPALYEGDLQTLHEIEAFAREKGATHVLILSPPHKGMPSFDWNPYDLRFMHKDAFRSNFHTPWTPHRFVRVHGSFLETLVTHEPDALYYVEQYLELAHSLPQEGPPFRYVIDPNNPGLVIVFSLGVF